MVDLYADETQVEAPRRDPNWLANIAAGKSAQNQMANVLRGPEMQQAMQMMNYQMPAIQNQGRATPNANIFSAFAQMAQNYRGQQKMNQLQEEARGLEKTREAGIRAAREQEQYRYDEDYRRQLERDRMRYQNQQDMAANRMEIDKRGKLKPSASERKSYVEADRLIGVINDLDASYANMDAAAKGEVDNAVMSAALNVLPNSGQRLAEQKLYKTDAARSYLTRGNRFESKLSQLMAGLNVTGFEMSDRQKWSPFAAGVGQEERQRRLDNIRRDLEGEVRGYEKFFPDYSIEREESNAPRMGAAAEAVEQAAQQAPMEPEMGPQQPMTMEQLGAQIQSITSRVQQLQAKAGQ